MVLPVVPVVPAGHPFFSYSTSQPTHISLPENCTGETYSFVTKTVIADIRAGTSGLVQYTGKVLSFSASTVVIQEDGTNDTIYIALDTVGTIRKSSQIKTAKPRLI